MANGDLAVSNLAWVGRPAPEPVQAPPPEPEPTEPMGTEPIYETPKRPPGKAAPNPPPKLREDFPVEDKPSYPDPDEPPPQEPVIDQGKPVIVEWGCDEDRTAEVTYGLGSGDEFVSAEVKVSLEPDYGQNTYRIVEPEYSAKERAVRARVLFPRLAEPVDKMGGGPCPSTRAVVQLHVVLLRSRPTAD